MDATATAGRQKTLGQAVWQITIADVSMSLDNVLAVAGAAREHPMILIFGLALSIALMGFAASFIARLLEKHRWIAYVGLAIILYVAFDMCYRGALEVWPHLFGNVWFPAPRTPCPTINHALIGIGESAPIRYISSVRGTSWLPPS